ncbi:MAG TPA: accessory factor UbiK family protein, partial [Gammaproteobacteria bacterium]|nr:accessory factor UbiK family protein [Gammaproteobacteria bacterium]
EQLQKLDVVPREEFDTQCAVLARTQAKLQELEQILTDLIAKQRTPS